ncbi:MAG: hypothetical protein KF901_07740 [Myxococcales bacterium]|nr:hypothetical protein [Myxococcales bacterium]
MSFDDFDDPLDPLAGGELPALELDLPAPPPRRSVEVASPQAEAKRPAKPAAPEDDIRAAEVRALAAYPEPPENPAAALLYVLTVWPRRRELRAQARDLAAREQVASRRADASLAQLGEALLAHPDALAGAGLDALAQRAQQDREAHASAAQAAAASREDQARARRDAEAARQTATAATEPLKAREKALADETDALLREKKRADAALQRVEIELRNALGDPATRAPLEPAFEARRAEAKLATERWTAKDAALRALRTELADALERLRRAEALIHELSREAERAGTSRVPTPRATTLRDLGEAGLHAGLHPSGGAANRARAAVEERDSVRRERALHERAADEYDAKGYLQGQMLIGVVMLVLLTAILALALR